MKTREFIKDFKEIDGDLIDAVNRELERTQDAPPEYFDGKSATPAAIVKELKLIEKEVMQRRKEVDRQLDIFDKKFEEVERERKKSAPASSSSAPAPAAPALDLKPFEGAFDKLGSELEDHVRWVRSTLVARKEFSDPFERAATDCFNALKKLETEVDKFGSAELKRAAKKEKPLQVVPSKFLAEYHALMKKLKMDPLKPIEERLKRLDSNHDFDKVTSLCDAAGDILAKTIKSLDKKTDKILIERLTDLSKDIEAYDQKMFLFSRLK